MAQEELFEVHVMEHQHPSGSEGVDREDLGKVLRVATRWERTGKDDN